MLQKFCPQLEQGLFNLSCPLHSVPRAGTPSGGICPDTTVLAEPDLWHHRWKLNPATSETTSTAATMCPHLLFSCLCLYHLLFLCGESLLSALAGFYFKTIFWKKPPPSRKLDLTIWRYHWEQLKLMSRALTLILPFVISSYSQIWFSTREDHWF